MPHSRDFPNSINRRPMDNGGRFIWNKKMISPGVLLMLQISSHLIGCQLVCIVRRLVSLMADPREV